MCRRRVTRRNPDEAGGDRTNPHRILVDAPRSATGQPTRDGSSLPDTARTSPSSRGSRMRAARGPGSSFLRHLKPNDVAVQRPRESAVRCKRELAGSGCARTLTIFTLERARCRWVPSTHSGEHRAVRPLQRLGLEALRRDLWPPAVRRTAGPDGSAL